MSQMSSPVPPVEHAAGSGSAVTALVLSLVGVGGWLTLFTILLPYGVGNNGTEKAINNVFAFGINFLLLVAGSSISGTLSFSGLLTGAFSLGSANDRLGYAAVALGVAGLIGGAVLVTWRHHLIFG